MSLPHVVVLHGANGSAVEIEPLAEALRPFGEVHVPNLLAHGGRPVPPRLTIQDQAADVLAWLDARGVDRAFFVGYSVGGYVALYLARHFPRRVQGACAIATKVVFDAPTVKHLTYLASPERLGRPGNPRAAVLEKHHAPQDWRAVTLANSRLFEDLGRAPPLDPEAFRAIRVPVMLVGSNRDQLVPWAETLELGKQIAGAKLVMFYGFAHPLARVPVYSVAKAIDGWMRQAP